MTKRITKKDRDPYVCIENALMAAKAMRAEGVLVITYRHGNIDQFIYNAGKDKRNDFAIKTLIKSIQ